MEPVTVLIPVGPNYNSEWLQEAVDSALNQTYKVNEIFFIIDGVSISIPDCFSMMHEVGYAENCYYKPYYCDAYFNCGGYSKSMIKQRGGKGCWHVTGPKQDRDEYMSYWRNPISLGFSASFNLGMALSNNELIMYLASDDKMLPDVVEKAVATWEKNNRKDAWYCCSYIDSDGNTCAIQNNLALTTKHFFLDMCGGYPPAAFVGPDAALLSCLMVHAPDRIIKVEEGTPLYWIRNHDQQETKIHTWKYVPEMNSIRNKLTLDFKFNES